MRPRAFHRLRQLPLLLAVLAFSGIAGIAAGAGADTAAGATTIVLVRHAERGNDDPQDPSLSPAGELRARDLVEILEGAGVTAVYATQYKRTRETAAPLARRFGLTVEQRPVAAGDATASARELAREALFRHAGETVVMVGHGDTVPELVKALCGRTVAPIPHEQYDRLFVVVVPRSGAPRLIEARYGPPSPDGERP